MKTINHIILTLAMIAMSQPLFAQNRADQQHLSDPGSSTIIIFGDPQGYIKYDLNQPIFELTTCWVADNVKNLNIKALLITGDMVEQNDNNALNRNMLNQSSRQMWEAVSRAMERVDGKVPYLICGGNHDYGYKSSEDYHTHLPDYFTFERQGDALKESLVAEYHNREGRASLENSAVELELPGWDKKILVITSEFTPSDGAIAWAKALCESDKYKDHIVFYMTHSYIMEESRGAGRIEKEKYAISNMPGNNTGQMVWDKLISQVPNIRFVLSGHVGHPTGDGVPDDFRDATAFRVDKNNFGKDVFQMEFNVQTLGGGWEGNGGDGWIRILEFLPDGKTVKASTYSPLFGISHVTKQFAHRTEKNCQFDFVIE